jgi:hypothetical protein
MRVRTTVTVASGWDGRAVGPSAAAAAFASGAIARVCRPLDRMRMARIEEYSDENGQGAHASSLRSERGPCNGPRPAAANIHSTAARQAVDPPPGPAYAPHREDMKNGWMHVHLQPQVIGGLAFGIDIVFEGERLDGYHLALLDTKYGTSWGA